VLKSFKAFIMRGSVVDLAVGVVVGVAFGAVVSSLVKDVIMPPIGLLLGKVDFSNLFWVLREGTVAGPYSSLAAAQEAGAVAISYGAFFNTVISFLIIAVVIFFLVVQPIAKLTARQKAEVPPTKECPYCLSPIPLKATRCPNCTSQLQKG